MIDFIRFDAIETVRRGALPAGALFRATLRHEGLLAFDETGKLVVTAKGHREWRVFRALPHLISLDQATMLTGLWGQVTAADLETKLDPGLIIEIDNIKFLDEWTAQKMFGPEHPELRMMWA